MHGVDGDFGDGVPFDAVQERAVEGRCAADEAIIFRATPHGATARVTATAAAVITGQVYYVTGAETLCQAGGRRQSGYSFYHVVGFFEPYFLYMFWSVDKRKKNQLISHSKIRVLTRNGIFRRISQLQ